MASDPVQVNYRLNESQQINHTPAKSRAIQLLFTKVIYFAQFFKHLAFEVLSNRLPLLGNPGLMVYNSMV
jgi:hypothetical protein